ncbi:adenylate/guanylate cyclase domain-containing protein [Nocardioides sp. P86]|uniref:adenylate/guanylate cyclase domain-containing protein n=1 Tax=Nocardioides sp. P86 TaxID=2939569 RepID=UPI0020405B57|nr:adenylate/guanylate cyclase domain-containing protein [Nocardioides sp. P86]MCM3514500.1 adenylate/guanylate cyclase domain-containing protein [Nocardioides sp. P86]
MTLAVVLLAALSAVLAAAVAALALCLSAARRRERAARRRIAVLEADLDVALRPRPAATPAERAVRRVVRTATRVREQGVAGLLQSSLEDLQAWAAEQQQSVASMASSDGRVTLLFSDIEGSTRLNERLGDATWVRVLQAHDILLRARIERYRGQVVKTAGDGFMVAFRDPEAACRAAVGVQRDLKRTLDPRLRLVAPVRVRIGIHTGPVVARDGDYFGRNVAMAARVADTAQGGEVLASEAVRAALDDDAAVDLVEAGEVGLKGLPGVHALWRVLPRGEVG